jgi:hypothetical protein
MFVKRKFPNVPFNPYHVTVTAAGFAPYAQDVEVRSAVPLSVKIELAVSGKSSAVTVTAGQDMLENDSTFHTDVDRGLFDKLPLESQSSSMSSLVTLATRDKASSDSPRGKSAFRNGSGTAHLPTGR